MSTIDLSSYDPNETPSGKGKKVSLVVSEWNREITDNLLRGAVETLIEHGVKEDDINIFHVPGSFELIHASYMLSKGMGVAHSVIAIGAIIRGETPHFDYISQSVANNLGHLNIQSEIPIIFGVLTTDTMQQAQDRSGGIHGNKGVEAAVTALKMMCLFGW